MKSKFCRKIEIKVLQKNWNQSSMEKLHEIQVSTAKLHEIQVSTEKLHEIQVSTEKLHEIQVSIEKLKSIMFYRNVRCIKSSVETISASVKFWKSRLQIWRIEIKVLQKNWNQSSTEKLKSKFYGKIAWNPSFYRKIAWNPSFTRKIAWNPSFYRKIEISYVLQKCSLHQNFCRNNICFWKFWKSRLQI